MKKKRWVLSIVAMLAHLAVYVGIGYYCYSHEVWYALDQMPGGEVLVEVAVILTWLVLLLMAICGWEMRGFRKTTHVALFVIAFGMFIPRLGILLTFFAFTCLILAVAYRVKALKSSTC